MFCPKCGEQLPDGTAFCTNCGNKLPSPTQNSVPPQQPQYMPPVFNNQSVYMPQPKKSSAKTGIIITISIIAALAIAGGAAWGIHSFLVKNKAPEITVFNRAAPTIDNIDDEDETPVVLTVNGNPVHADEYAAYLQSNMQSYSKTYDEMGLTDIWNNSETAEQFGPAVIEAAKQQVVLIRMVLEKFQEYGLTMSDDDLKDLENSWQENIDQLGEDSYLDTLAQIGFTPEQYENYLYISKCATKLSDYFYGENGTLTPSDSELHDYFRKNYIITAQHILIMTDNPATGDTIRTDAEAKAIAQSLLNRINSGEDFNTLMNLYGEDPGVESNSNGYTFIKGQMVDEFYNGAIALSEGEISGLVKSNYGYHIIKRLPLDESQFDEVRDSIVTELVGSIDDLMQQWMDEADVQTTELFDTITYQNVQDYLAQEVQDRLNTNS